MGDMMKRRNYATLDGSMSQARIPRVTARLQGFGTTIFVLGADGKPQPRRIRLGAADAENSIVLGGELKAGDRVITGEPDPKAPPGGDGEE